MTSAANVPANNRMNDIVERLRRLPYRPMVNYGNGDVRDELDPDIAEAADEIEQLRADNDWLRKTIKNAIAAADWNEAHRALEPTPGRTG
jgi:hypothetical protein